MKKYALSTKVLVPLGLFLFLLLAIHFYPVNGNLPDQAFSSPDVATLYRVWGEVGNGLFWLSMIFLFALIVVAPSLVARELKSRT